MTSSGLILDYSYHSFNTSNQTSLKLHVSTLKQYTKISCTDFHPFYSQACLNYPQTRLVKNSNTNCCCITECSSVFRGYKVGVLSRRLYKTGVITTHHCMYHSLASKVNSNIELGQNRFSP